MDTIILRNDISKVSHAFPADYARRLLADPFHGKHLSEVRTEKPEVLSQPEAPASRKADRTEKAADDVKNEES